MLDKIEIEINTSIDSIFGTVPPLCTSYFFHRKFLSMDSPYFPQPLSNLSQIFMKTNFEIQPIVTMKNRKCTYLWSLGNYMMELACM